MTPDAVSAWNALVKGRPTLAEVRRLVDELSTRNAPNFFYSSDGLIIQMPRAYNGSDETLVHAIGLMMHADLLANLPDSGVQPVKGAIAFHGVPLRNSAQAVLEGFQGNGLRPLDLITDSHGFTIVYGRVLSFEFRSDLEVPVSPEESHLSGVRFSYGESYVGREPRPHLDTTTMAGSFWRTQRHCGRRP